MTFDSAPVPAFMPFRYDPLVVAVSFVIATFASYVTLDLARRVRQSTWGLARVWWGAGSVVMGSGIWSMHFVGMQAFEVPITLGYRGGLTLLSWVAAVAASAVALEIASRKTFSYRRVVLGALVMGLGISAMHYIGMAALELVPGIVWNWSLVAASVLIAVLASATALLIFHLLLKVPRQRRLPYQMGAALVMGVAICGMHYTGMIAARIPDSAICLSSDGLGGPSLTAMLTIATGLLLVSTLFTSLLDARMQGTTQRLAQSLQESNTKLQTANAELKQRAFTDPLTGLPNRLLFEERLGQALLRADRANHRGLQSRVAVIFVDLDGFKPVNDSFGHAAGDALLRDVAQRLRRLLREEDTVARIGGDEFLLLLENLREPADALAFGQRVLQVLATPFDLSGRHMRIAGSIGIVTYPDQQEADKLVAQADAAMYAAKRGGGGSCALFEPHMNADATEQLELQNDLRRALEHNELTLHYQPKIDATRQLITGVEALLRWRHPVRGMVSPAVFIALAERFGLINRLGSWVIDEACRQIRAWEEQGLRMPVAVNLSVHQLREQGLAQRIEQALQRHGVAPSQLLCEITESVAMEDFQEAQRSFAELAAIGVYLSIDDFGTGYSSLNYLRQLPVQQLKIDSSFVRDLDKGNNARAVVQAVISLAHALGLRVVAEGVETPAQRDILLSMACDELQGYLYARAMTAEELLDWAQGRQARGSVAFSPSLFGEP
jgi:diguanylate cyclase (GGDEF)-like protein